MTCWNIVRHFGTLWNILWQIFPLRHFGTFVWISEIENMLAGNEQKVAAFVRVFSLFFCRPLFFRLWGFQFMFFGGGFFWPALGFLLREIVPECWNGNRLLQKSGKRVAAFSLFFCAPRVFFRCGNSSYMNRETDILFCICTHLWNKFVFCIECNTIYLLSRIPRNYYIVFFCLRPCISPRPIKIIYPSKAP